MNLGLQLFKLVHAAKLSIAEKAVMYSYCEYINHETGQAWPNQDNLAAGAGCTVRNLRRTLAKLLQRGIINMDLRHRNSTLVTFNFDALSKLVLPDSLSGKKPPSSNTSWRTSCPSSPDSLSSSPDSLSSLDGQPVRSPSHSPSHYRPKDRPTRKSGDDFQSGAGETDNSKTQLTQRIGEFIKDPDISELITNTEFRRRADITRNKLIDSKFKGSLENVATRLALFFKSIREEMHTIPTIDQLCCALDDKTWPNTFGWGQLICDKNKAKFRDQLLRLMKLHKEQDEANFQYRKANSTDAELEALFYQQNPKLKQTA